MVVRIDYSYYPLVDAAQIIGMSVKDVSGLLRLLLLALNGLNFAKRSPTFFSEKLPQV